jgi:hypothetical protein
MEAVVLRYLIILCAVGAAFRASAGEQLFTGRVEKIVLRPTGSANCPPPCPPAVTRADGSMRVCVSNAGGCQSTDITVQDVYAGDLRPGSTITVESRTGEWGGTTFPESRGLILVNLDDNVHRWTATEERDGKLFLNPGRSPYIAGIPVKELGANEQGLVSLDQFLARMRAKQGAR